MVYPEEILEKNQAVYFVSYFSMEQLVTGNGLQTFSELQHAL